MCSAGSYLYVDFGSQGVWGYDGANWSKVTGKDPIVMGTYANKLVADFPVLGMWRYDGTWQEIDRNNCEDMTAVDLY